MPLINGDFLILDQEEIRMKFNKSVIIKGKMMNGNKALVCGWDMQHIVKHEITRGVGIMELPM
jgi:hypothetical protein